MQNQMKSFSKRQWKWSAIVAKELHLSNLSVRYTNPKTEKPEMRVFGENYCAYSIHCNLRLRLISLHLYYSTYSFFWLIASIGQLQSTKDRKMIFHGTKSKISEIELSLLHLLHRHMYTSKYITNSKKGNKN